MLTQLIWDEEEQNYTCALSETIEKARSGYVLSCDSDDDWPDGPTVGTAGCEIDPEMLRR